MSQDEARKLRAVNVLIVDDDGSTRNLVREQLRDMGFEHIAVAGDGHAALLCIADRIKVDPDLRPFDLIICDWRMPEVNGLELLKMIRHRYPKLPFVMLSALHTAEDVHAAVAAGVSAYIMKPIVPAELRKKITTLIVEAQAS